MAWYAETSRAMTEFDAILFDFDGVLVDSEPMHWRCWAEVLKPIGVMLDWEFYREQCIGIDDREMLRMMATRCDPPRDWEHLWAQYPTKRELFRSRMLTAPPFPAGLGGLLEELRGKYRMAVVTSSGRPEVEPMLEAGGLRQYFDAMVCARDAARHKPAPDPYLRAAELLSARRPLVLEDSEAGVASGRAAGFEVLVVPDAAQTAELLRLRLSGSATPAGGG
jgi:beta-phosphoglucomutase